MISGQEKHGGLDMSNREENKGSRKRERNWEKVEKINEEIKKITPIIEEIEILEANIYKKECRTDNDTKRVLELKEKIGNAPIFEVIFFDGHSRLYARTSLLELKYKLSKYLKTISACISLTPHNEEKKLKGSEDQNFIDMEGKVTLRALNIELTMLEDIQNWSNADWEDITGMYSKKMDFSIYVWIERILSLQKAQEIGGFEIIRMIKNLPLRSASSTLEVTVSDGLDVKVGRSATGQDDQIDAGSIPREVTPVSDGVDIKGSSSTGQDDQTDGSMVDEHWNLLVNLLAVGADPRAGNSRALVEASRNGHERIVVKLISAQADPAAPGSNALVEAGINGHASIVKILVEAGADEEQARVHACENGHEGLLEILIDGNDGPALDYNFYFPELTVACENGQEGIVEKLLAAGADPNASEPISLLIASEDGHEGIVEKLLAAGAEPNQVEALWRATVNGHEGIVEKLLAARAKPDGISRFYRPIKAAFASGYDGIVSKLLGAGANPFALE